MSSRAVLEVYPRTLQVAERKTICTFCTLPIVKSFVEVFVLLLLLLAQLEVVVDPGDGARLVGPPVLTLLSASGSGIDLCKFRIVLVPGGRGGGGPTCR